MYISYIHFFLCTSTSKVWEHRMDIPICAWEWITWRGPKSRNNNCYRLKSSTENLALYRELDLPPLSHQIFVTRMTTLHDILNCDIDGRLNRETIRRVSDHNPYNTRRGGDLSMDLPRTEHRQRSFLYTSIKEWNQQLPTTRTAIKTTLKYRPNPNPYYSHELSRLDGVSHEAQKWELWSQLQPGQIKPDSYICL